MVGLSRSRSLGHHILDIECLEGDVTFNHRGWYMEIEMEIAETTCKEWKKIVNII
jgi:hypothetical protein